LIAAPAAAQSITGRIMGTVRDETQSVVPGATVTVTDSERGSSRVLVTGGDGRYVALNLPPGEYDVSAELPGFRTAVRSGVLLSVGREAVVDLVLQIGGASETIDVTGDAPLVDTATSSLSNLVDEATLKQLPLDGRDYMKLATLTMGVSEARTMSASFAAIAGGGTKLTVGGARPDMNQVLVDGTDAQDAYNYTPGGAAGVSLGVDTLQEFRIMKSNYSAEFGRAAGGVINTVTKSGTNTLRGSVFEYHRNSAMDASNFFDQGEDQPDFVRNQFGFVLGGPIIRNKTFFFGSFEGLRERLGTTRFGNVPTPETRAGYLPLRNGLLVPTDRGGVMTFVGVHPAIQPYLNLYPLPTGGRDNLDGTAEYVVSVTEPTNEDYYLLKIDQSFTASHSFFGRYSLDDSDQLLLHTIPPFGRENFTRRQLLTLEDKLIISPTLVNVFRVGVNRAHTGQQNLDPGMDPNLSFVPGRLFGQIAVTGLSSIGTERVSDLVRDWNHLEITDSLDWVRGKHALVIGANYKRIQVEGLQGFAQYGQFHFQNLKDFLENRTNLLDVALPDSNLNRDYRLWQLSAFIQDDWQVSSRLSLNLGLRYDFTSVGKEANGLISNLREARQDGGTPETRIPADATFVIGDPFYKNPSKLNFAPRLGFAWTPTGDQRMVIRGGGGVFYSPILPANFQIAGFAAPPFTLRLNIPRAEFPRGWLEQDTSSLLRNLFVQPFEFEPAQPTMYHWNLTMQREVLPQTVLTLGYVGSRGIHLSRVQNVNVNEFEIRPDGSKFFPVGTTRPNKNFAGMGVIAFDTNSTYHSLQAQISKRMSAGLQFQGSYTFGKLMDAAAGDHGGSSGGVTTSMDPFDWRRDWSRSSFDVTHNVSLSAVYDLPSPQSGGVAGKLLGGWQVSSIVRIASGLPLNVTMAGVFDPARAGTWWVGDGQSQRPDAVPGVDPVLDDFDPREGYLNPAAFALPALGTFGNLGRYAIVGPGLQEVNFSVVKNTGVGATNVQFRVEIFNLLNRANFAQPSTGIYSNVSGVPTATFGRIDNTSTTARQIQLALRLTF
jgi:outer membrane receptor protein involved in Fe transport